MKPNWHSTPNALRKRKQIHVTMSPEGIAELDAQRGEKARGEYVEALLGNQRATRKNWLGGSRGCDAGTKLSRKNRPKGT